MKKILLLFVAVITLSSCGKTFKVSGSSDMPPIDGKKLYLKISENNEEKIIDSCEVVHGTFNFNGSVDTTRLAEVFIDDEHKIIFILDNSNISIKINRKETKVNGTAPNDSLTNFFQIMDGFAYRTEEIINRRNEAIMEGLDIDAVDDSLRNELIEMNKEQAGIVTNFIKANYDNILGPTIFKMIVSKQYPAPILDSWTEEIMAEATNKFKNDVFVKDFYAEAQKNQEILNGMRTPSAGQSGENDQSNP